MLQKLAVGIMEAEKSYDPPLASRRTKKASGVRPSPKARESGVSLRATGSRSASVRRPGHEPMDGSGQAERADPPCPRLPASPKPLADCTTPACPGEGGLRSAYQPKRQSLPETPSRTRSEVTRGLPSGCPLTPSSRRGGSDRHASAASTSVPIAARDFQTALVFPKRFLLCRSISSVACGLPGLAASLGGSGESCLWKMEESRVCLCIGKGTFPTTSAGVLIAGNCRVPAGRKALLLPHLEATSTALRSTGSSAFDVCGHWMLTTMLFPLPHSASLALKRSGAGDGLSQRSNDHSNRQPWSFEGAGSAGSDRTASS